jgi:hypothetical protein
MKTKNILLFVAVAGMTAAFTSNVRAVEPLLSPRAKAPQAQRVSGITEDHINRSLFSGSPRAETQGIRIVPGTSRDSDLAHGNHLASGSPKASPLYHATNRNVHTVASAN